MKSSLKSRALGVVAATAMAAVMTVGGATAAQASPGTGVELNGDVSAAACKSASGGDWCYGTSWDGLLKKCYSNYKHNSRYHSATAAMASQTSTRYAQAGYWAKASVTAGHAYTCYTYYNDEA